MGRVYSVSLIYLPRICRFAVFKNKDKTTAKYKTYNELRLIVDDLIMGGPRWGIWG